jgi:lysophospholipase L1-like esterase
MKNVMCMLVLILAYLPAFSQAGLQVKPDTVKVRNAELVIQNSTSDSLGFLYNTGRGQTSFKRLRLLNIGDTALAIIGQDTLRYKGSGSGKSIQFKTGTTGAPAAGDSVYTNISLIGGNVKVWRNGVFQYRDDSDGIYVDSTNGKIIFRPALAQGDRIYIEAMTGITLVFQGSGPAGPPPFSTNLKSLYAGVFNNGDNTYTLRWATNNKTLSTSPRVVGLGSSTLSGYNLSYPDRLGDKINAWLNSNTTSPVWINLAVAGYATSNVMPTAAGGTAGTNIDSALNSKPDFIFISLPTNDIANGLTVAQVLTAFRKLDTMALNKGVPIFWETTQPRTACTAAQQTQLKILADSIRAVWPTRYVEGFSNTVDPNGTTDAAINPTYAQSDGVHLTSAGNQLIANALFARWQSYFQALTGVQGYIVETSTDGSSWTQLDAITDPTTVKKTYTRSGTGAQYFRVRAQYTNQTFSAYSNAVLLFASGATTGGGAPSGGSASRILVDLGGDGATTMAPDGVTPLGQSTTSPDANGNYWNNWYGTGSTGFRDGSTISNLVAANNSATGLSLKFIGAPAGTFNSAATQGINANGFTTAVYDYPASAVSDNVFLYSSINPNGVILRVKGMDKTKSYSIKLWGARLDNATTPRILETSQASDFSNSKTFNTRYAPSDTADYNRATTYNIGGVDSTDIYMRVGSGSTFASLSLLDITTSTYTGGTTPTAPNVLVRDTSVTLPNSGLQLPGIVTANGNTISSYQWTQVSGPNTTTIANATSATCTITGLTTGTFVYRLTVTTSTGSTYSDDATVTVSAASGSSTSLQINFSNSAISVPGWFNVHGPVTGNHVVMTDTNTGWGIDNVGASTTYWSPYGSNSADTIGTSTGNNSGVVPDAVLKGCWYNYSDKYVSTDNMYITGLNPAKTYTLVFVASRSAGAPSPRSGAYHINGGAELLLNAASNTSQSLTAQHIAPDANGKIRLAIYAPANTTANGAFSYINALIITQE